MLRVVPGTNTYLELPRKPCIEQWVVPEVPELSGADDLDDEGVLKAITLFWHIYRFFILHHPSPPRIPNNGLVDV
jgi:hypothetical protein